MHLNQSLKTDGRYPNSAPDFGGAIEVDNEGNVNGVDVTMPVLNFTETHTMAGTRVSTSYSAGEVLFLGASGTKRSRKATAPWEITYRFAVSPNKAGFRVGDIQVNRKCGWDYLWVRYADKVAEGGRNVVKKPVAAYVEQVYPEGDFGNLGLGN